MSGVTDPKPGASACGAAAPPRSPAGTWNLSYIPGTALTSGGTLRFTLSSTPDPNWAASPAASPPSFTTEQLPAVGFSMPSGATTLMPGRSTTIHIGIAAAAEGATSVEWQAQPGPGGLTVSPSAGTLGLGSSDAAAPHPPPCAATAPVTAAVTVTAPATATGSIPLRFELHTAGGTTLPPVVVDVDVKG